MPELYSVDAVGDPLTPDPYAMASMPPESYDIPSPEVAEDRAFKFNYGLGDILKRSKEQIFDEISLGGEGALRAEAAAEANLRRGKATQEAIKELAKRKGNVPLTMDDIRYLEATIGSMNKDTDPASVMEEAFSKAYIDSLDIAARRSQAGSILDSVSREQPSEYAKTQAAGKELGAMVEYLNTWEKRLDKTYEAQSTIGAIGDVLKNIIPGYSYTKPRGQVSTTGTFDNPFSTGTNIAEQSKALFSMPFPQFKTEVDRIFTQLEKDNPGLARSFLNDLKGQAVTDRILNDVMPFLDVAGIPVVKGARGARAAYTNRFNDHNRAVRSMLKSVHNADSVPNINAVAGDLETAGIQKATANVVADAKGLGEPTARAVEDLPTMYKLDNQNIAANPGRGGQELATRLEQESNTILGKFFTGLTNALKVNRLGGIAGAETTMRAVTEQIKDIYVGVNNRILDVGKLEFEPLTGGWYTKVLFGDGGGKFFASKTVAENFARHMGWTDVKIVGQAAAENVYYIPQAAVKRPWEKNDRVGEFFVDPKSNKPFYRTDDGAFVELSDKPIKGGSKIYRDGDNLRLADGDAETGIYYVPQAAVKRGWEKSDRVGEMFIDPKTKIPYYKTDDGSFVQLSSQYEDGMIALKADGKNLTFDTSDPAKTAIKQQGTGFYIERIQFVDETDGRIRHVMKQLIDEEPTAMTKSPKGLVTSFLGRLMNPDDVLSVAHQENRKIATYGPSIIREILQENAREIKDLIGWKNITNKQRWKDFNSVIKSGTTLRDPDTGLTGYFFKSPGELEDYYQRFIGRLPDEKEIRAYFAFKRGMEMDRMLRNIAQHRNMVRVGAETHQFFSLTGTGTRVGSGEFAGVRLPHFPKASEGNVLIVGHNVGDETVIALSNTSGKAKKEWGDLVRDGRYVAVEVYNPEARPFKGFGDKTKSTRIQYVLAPNMETKQLDWNQIPRRGGGHIEYDYDFYLKQAKIRYDKVGRAERNWYEGDTTIMPIRVAAMGENVAKHLNQVREMLKEGQEEAAKAYSDANLHISWDIVGGWFKPSVDEAGNETAARLSTREPIFLVPRDKAITQVSNDLELRNGGKQRFRDGTKQGSLARQFQVQFTGERDAEALITMVDKGSRGKPLYEIADAEAVNPIETMNRGLARIVNSNFMDDYKIFGVESWLAEAAPYLDDSIQNIRHSPFWHFNNPTWRAAADGATRARLESMRVQIQNFVGVPSSTDSLLNSAAQKLMDSVYTHLGPKAVEYFPTWALPFVKDPARYIRSVVFHTNIGLFNIPQFIVQSMNFVNMSGIAGPSVAMSGIYAAQLHMWGTINKNPAILDRLDQMATRLVMPGMHRWKPGEWKEAYQALMNSGFGNIGREYSILDDIMTHKIVSNKGQDFLEAGGIFFRGGERNARNMSYFTSYAEWRKANPTAVLDREAQAAILNRADLLNMNMSRANNSMLHSGVLSIPTQFYTYPIRVAELMLGKRLTWQEKARLFGANAFMFGIPAAASVTGYPFADHIRSYALENGYVVGENFLKSLMMEGIPAAMVALTLGSGDASKGTWLNVGPRYGNNGIEILNSFFRGDKTLWDVFGGAAYSKLKSTWESSDGFRASMMSFIREDDKYHPMVIDDLIDVTKEVSSVNAAVRLLRAIHTGRWESKKEGYITDVSKKEAVFSTLTGLTDQNIADIFRKSQSIKAQKGMEEEAEKAFKQEYVRYLQAMRDENPTASATYWKRARAILNTSGYPEDKIIRLIGQAAGDNKSIIDRINWKFYMEAPKEVKDIRRESFTTITQMNKQKTGE